MSPESNQSQTLAGKKVLLTRERPEPIKSLLEAHGAEVLQVPCISIVDPPDWHPFDEAANNQGNQDVLILTSKEAVTRMFARLEKLGLTLAEHLQIAVVGTKTESQLNKFGHQADLVPKDFQAEGLIELFETMELKGKSIWFPRALLAREVLVEYLHSRGANIKVTPCYQNVIPTENNKALQDQLQEGIDWICFASGSSVENFFRLLDGKTKGLSFAKIASIGKITTQELLKHGLEPTVTARVQTLEGLAEAILEEEHGA